MSGTGPGNTPTRVGWIAAFVVGAAVFAVLRYPAGFLLLSSIAFAIAAMLVFLLLLSSSGGADAGDARVRKIVPQPLPQPLPQPVSAPAEPPAPAVMPNRVTAQPKADAQPEMPASDAAAPFGLVEAPPAAAELVSRRKPAAPKAVALPETERETEPEPAAKPAPKPVAEGKPKAAKPEAKNAAKPNSAKPKAAKPKVAKAEGPARLAAPRGGKPDDLKEIEGIGPALEKLVNSLGFHHFDQIANWSDADIALVDAEMKNFKGRIARDRWVAQARIIVSEGLEAFRIRAKTNNY